MADTPTDPERTGSARRVSTNPRTDREIREQRRDLIGAMLLTRTSYRKMAELLAQPTDRGGLGIAVSLGAIASDVAVIRRRWSARMVESFSGHVSEQMAYYDGLLRALAPKALTGQHNAVVDLLAVLDRRARLVGMDQPDKVLVGVGTVGVDSVEERWGNAPREEQIARTEQILAIIHEAVPLRLEGGPPLLNPEPGGDVIDLVERLDHDDV
jgi:hypothetical protein